VAGEEPRNHAVGFTRFGGPEVLTVVARPMPTAGPGEVVVRVAAATVNPTDTLLRAGRLAAGMKGTPPPYTPGMEFAGHVHEVGHSVEELAVGQPVMGVTDPSGPTGGAQATYVRVPAASLAAVPEGTELSEAATIPMNGLTALMVVEELAAAGGGTVLVTGGPGAVGGYTIPLAKRAGLTVFTDGRPEDQAFLRDLGADEIVPRGEQLTPAVRALRPHGVDALVDTAQVGDAARALVRDGGTVVGLRSSGAAPEARLRYRLVMVGTRLTDAQSLVSLAAYVREGVLHPRVALRLPMSQAAEAHRLVEKGGMRGRVVLTFDLAD
jgi:NADPH:quinone reductase-like Zn-dependent oxidoreductase